MKEPFKNDEHHLKVYEAFATEWGINDLESLVKFYDVHELSSFLPTNPTNEEKKALQALIGVTTNSGYMDYQRSNNTFELIMQWKEKTSNVDDNNPFLKRG